jgi:hypothetical protein
MLVERRRLPRRHNTYAEVPTVNVHALQTTVSAPTARSCLLRLSIGFLQSWRYLQVSYWRIP